MSIDAKRQNMVKNYGFAGTIPRSRRFFLPKACFYTGNVSSQKMYVGLSPKNEHTKMIAHQLELWMCDRDFQSCPLAVVRQGPSASAEVGGR
jgi:hypothetical protein